MRLEQKYFVPFLLVCALLTAIVIVITSLNYASNQRETFREEASETDLSGWKLYQYRTGDSLSMAQFEGSPVVIHFWSTWSELSIELNDEMSRLKSDFPDLVILAAASRDAEEKVQDYLNGTDYNFIFADGTPLYQELKVPGLPSQLFVNRQLSIVDQNVGRDPEAIRQKVQQLIDQ